MRQHFAGRGVTPIWGQRRDRFIASPAVGAEWAFTLPAGHWYRLLIGFSQLKTSAQAANRYPSLQIKDGDGLVRFQTVDAGAVVAEKVVSVSYGVDVTTTAGGSGTALTIGLPDLMMEAGWSVGSITPNIQTEDQYSAIRLLFEEVIDGAPVHAAGVDEHEGHERHLAALVLAREE